VKKNFTYFSIFDLAPAFLLDEGLLRKRFLINSKKYHPDFHTLEDQDKQDEILEQSSLNNQAFKTLKDFSKRMHYLLSEKGLVGEGIKNELPQDFLMEMMDINEELMELDLPAGRQGLNYEMKIKKVEDQIGSFQKEWRAEVEPYLLAHDDNPTEFTDYEPIKNFYLKERYLLRIRENLNKFATR